MRRAIEDAMEWEKINEKGEKRDTTPSTISPRTKWKPPKPTWVKCNVNGAERGQSMWFGMDASR